MKYFYGSSANSREDYPQGVFQWHLDRIEDTNGNYLTVSYYRPATTAVGGMSSPKYYTYRPLYPSIIEYSGNVKTATLPYYSIEFSLEARSDNVVAMGPNQRTILEYRLAKISTYQDVHGAKTPIRNYPISYSNTSVSGLSRITVIQHNGLGYKNDSQGNPTIPYWDTLPAMTFDWGNGWDGSFTDRVSVQIPYTIYQPLIADIDADGQDEVLLKDTIYHFNTSSGTFTSVPLAIASAGSWDTDCLAINADVNGDGKQDIVITCGNIYSPGRSTLQVFLSNGNNTFGINAQPNFQKVLPLGHQDPATGVVNGAMDLAYVPADINGDGRTDFYLTYRVVTGEGQGHNYVQAIIANADGSFSGLETFPGFLGWPWPYYIDQTHSAYNVMQSNRDERLVGAGDLNGDGRTDLLFTTKNYPGSGTKPIVDAWLSKGDGTFSVVVSEIPDFLSAGSSLGDFNGDGNADIYVHRDLAGRSIYFSNGDGSFDIGHPTSFSRPEACNDLLWFNSSSLVCVERLRDVDGDGKTDVVTFKFRQAATFAVVEPEIYVYRGQQDGSIFLEYSPVYSKPFRLDGTYKMSLLLGDFAGDGGSDFFIQRRGGVDSFQVITSRQANQDLLSSFDNGYGALTSIDYLPSARFPNTNLNFIFPVVSRTAVNDGVGTTAITDYGYAGGYYDHPTRELRGFEFAYATHPDLSREKTKYYRDEYFSHQVDFNELYSPAANGGALLRRTANTWSGLDFSNGSKFTRATNTTTSYYDNAAASAYISKDYTYSDTNGLLTKTVTSGTGTHGAVIEESSYENLIPTGWCWRPRVKSLKEADQTKIRQTTYEYFRNGTANLQYVENWLQEKAQNASDPRISFTYDLYGNIASKTDARNNVTTTLYESIAYAFPSKVFYPSTNRVMHVKEYPEYNYGLGLANSVKDENNRFTDYLYDPFGRLIQTDFPDGGRTTIVYNDEAFPSYSVTKTSENNTGSTIDAYAFFDGLGRDIEHITLGETGVVSGSQPTSKSVVTQKLYDVMGRNYLQQGPFFGTGVGYAQTPPAAYHWQLTKFDFLGRPVQVITPDETYSQVQTSYQYAGFAKTIIDPDQDRRDEKYNFLGQLEEVVEYADNNRQLHTYYTYNAAGNLLTTRNALNNLAVTGYDTLGRKISMNDPDLGAWSYTYDLNNNLKTQTDAKNQTVSFVYDELNRLTYKAYSTIDPPVTYSYDGASVPNGIGRLAAVTNGLVTTSHNVYDAMGRDLKVTRTITGAAQGFSTSYEYDLAGRQTAITYPDGYRLTNNYYAHSPLLEKVKGQDGVVYGRFANYEPNAKIGSVFHGNGAVTSFTYDPWSTKLTAIVTEDPSALPANDLQRKVYGYSRAGDIDSIWDDLRGINYIYQYDSLHRLKMELVTGNTSALQQRPEQLHYSYGQSSHLHAVSSINSGGVDYAYSYDANGNLKSGPDFTDASLPATRQLVFNVENLPTTITHSTGGLTSLTYGGEGVRTIKDANGKVTLYVNNLYEVIDGVATKYIFGNNLRLAKVTPTTINYFHKDHLNSSVVVTNGPGQKIEASENTPYGSERLHEGIEASDYKFTDQELDRSTNLYDYDARQYDPWIGRFISPDTVIQDYANPQSLNRYSYVQNNPLKYIDPTGRRGVTLSSPLGANEKTGELTGPLGVIGALFNVAGINHTSTGIIDNPDIPVTIVGFHGGDKGNVHPENKGRYFDENGKTRPGVHMKDITAGSNKHDNELLSQLDLSIDQSNNPGNRFNQANYGITAQYGVNVCWDFTSFIEGFVNSLISLVDMNANSVPVDNNTQTGNNTTAGNDTTAGDTTATSDDSSDYQEERNGCGYKL